MDDDKLPRLVRRLFQPDLYSGWGLRTLSTENPSYNPISYHLGSVWAVENGTILFGAAFWAVIDEGANTALGLTPGPAAFPWQTHARGLAGHLVFGLATDAVLRLTEAGS